MILLTQTLSTAEVRSKVPCSRSWRLSEIRDLCLEPFPESGVIPQARNCKILLWESRMIQEKRPTDTGIWRSARKKVIPALWKAASQPCCPATQSFQLAFQGSLLATHGQTRISKYLMKLSNLQDRQKQTEKSRRVDLEINVGSRKKLQGKK